MLLTLPNVATWSIAAAATLAVILRPFGAPEAIWAVAGALLLLFLGLIPFADALAGVMRGLDVYLFLIGMMLLAEAARREGLFDWLAQFAVHYAKGSATRFFALIYVIGVVVTAVLSNDATAVVMTPAVFAAARAAKAEPLPYLFICAFIANAASFVLPISNPANLVVFGAHLPALGGWLAQFALPSLLSIGATYIVLRWTQRSHLSAPIETSVDGAPLSTGGKIAAAAIVLTAVGLTIVSALGRDLGLPTMIAGILTLLLLAAARCGTTLDIVRGVSWSVLPLVAGLFVLVEALQRSGVVRLIADTLHRSAVQSETVTAGVAGAGIAVLTNLMNNLPAGLIAGSAVQMADVSPKVAGAVLIGVDLGPNLSVTGSLATILWLIAIRREGEDVSAWTFLKLGALVMPPALILALAALLLQP